MRRSLLLIGTVALLFCSALTVFAQIPNPGFESWTGVSPDNWFTNNVPGLWVPVTQSRTAHSGTFAVRGEVISGVALPFYSPQIVAGTSADGFSYDQRSATITGYYQFFPVAGSGDRFSIDALLWKGGAGGSGVAVAGAALPTAVSSYTQFSVPFTYLTGDVPDWCTINIIIIGPSSGTPQVGSYFLVDDLAFAGTTPTAVNNSEISTPNAFKLQQNYPNPFNPSTKIDFSLAQPGFVMLKIYDVLGAEVATLVNEQKSTGSYRVNWNAAGLPSGVYLYRITVSSEKGQLYNTAKRLVLVK